MTVVTYGDAASALAAALRVQLADELAPYAAGVRVGTKVPTGNDPYADAGPLVVVSQNAAGTPQERANARVPLRLMVWHSTDDDAYDLAQLVHGLALAHSGPVIRSVLAGTSPWVTPDPDTGEPLASCTVTANVRARLHPTA